MNENINCKNCGNDKFLKGIQQNQGKIFPMNTGFMSMGSLIIHEFCSECGLIKNSFVENTNKFK